MAITVKDLMKTSSYKTTLSIYKDMTIYRTLISPVYQKDKLEMCPHRKWRDLAIVYRFQLDEKKTGFITYEQAEFMGLTEKDLYKMSVIPEPQYEGLLAKMLSMFGDIGTDFPVEEEHTYVLTTMNVMYGASCVLDTKFLKSVIKGNAYIVPSSIHEVLIHPVNKITKEGLNQMINEVNESVVEPNIRLGDHVYYWNGKAVVIPTEE